MTISIGRYLSTTVSRNCRRSPGTGPVWMKIGSSVAPSARKCAFTSSRLSSSARYTVGPDSSTRPRNESPLRATSQTMLRRAVSLPAFGLPAHADRPPTGRRPATTLRQATLGSSKRSATEVSAGLDPLGLTMFVGIEGLATSTRGTLMPRPRQVARQLRAHRGRSILRAEGGRNCSRQRVQRRRRGHRHRDACSPRPERGARLDGLHRVEAPLGPLRRSSDALHDRVNVRAFESHGYHSLGWDAPVARGQSPSRQKTARHVASDALATAPEHSGGLTYGQALPA